jgi:DNA-binding IclR family transcriptional regulator
LDLSDIAPARVASIPAMEQSHLRDTRRASSADRTLAVLDRLADRGRPMRPMALSRDCGIPRSTIYRLLGLMRSRGYVSRAGGNHAWTLGPRMLEIAGSAPTIDQALRVLEAFDSASPHLTLGDIAARCDLDIQLVGRLAEALLTNGLLRAEESGRLSLGPRVVALAARAAPIEHLVRTARPYLERLRDLTGETANLLVRDGASAVYLDQAESPRTLRVSGWLGRRIPLASSAGGAALTGDGVRVVSGAVEPGVIAVACRIPGPRSLDAAVSVTAPTIRLRALRLEHTKAEVVATAALIGEALTIPATQGPGPEPRSRRSAGSLQPQSADGSRSAAPRRGGNRLRAATKTGRRGDRY